MKTGVVLSYSEGLGEEFRWCMAQGIESCQLSVAPDCQTKEIAAKIKGWVAETGMEITSLVGTWSGPNEWNFTHGPLTLGIVPPAYRQARMKELLHLMVKSSVAQNKTNRDTIQLDFLRKACKVA